MQSYFKLHFYAAITWETLIKDHLPNLKDKDQLLRSLIIFSLKNLLHIEERLRIKEYVHCDIHGMY